MAGDIRVLHVDNEPDFAELTATLLEREDERLLVESATSAETGFAKLSASSFDCVVADYDMPALNGIEFLENVRDAYPDLPFILFTGKGSEEVASDAISAGVTDYLQKRPGTDQFTLLANRIRNVVAARRAAEEVRRRRHRLEQILKTVPACVVQIDYDGEFVFANDRAEAVLGLEEDDVTDLSYNDPEWDITDLDGDPIPDEELPFRLVRDAGEPLDGYRHTIEWPDGTRKVLRVNGAPLFDTEGNVESTVFALTDITERQERERDLEVFRALLDQSHDSVIVADPESARILDCNRTTCEQLGYDRETLLGMTILDIQEKFDGLSEWREHIEQLPAEGRVFFQGTHRRKDGSTYPVEIDTGLVTIDGTEYLLGVVRNISHRRERDRELEWYETLIEAAGDPVFTLDPEGRYTFVNQAWVQETGYSTGEILGEHVSKVLADEDLEHGRAIIRDLLEEEGRRTGTWEATRVNADGSRDPVEIHVALLPDDDGEFRGTTGIVRDISGRKERERALQRQIDRLDEFTSVVSHDLRTPLMVAKGRLELARDEVDNEHLETVAQAHQRMEDLIDDLLVLAREGDASTEELDAVDLAETAEACWATVETAEASLVTEADRTIQAHRTRLQQLLENLIRNAVEHGGEDVTVVVGDVETGFYVEDDGVGIPEEERDRVFETGYTTTETGTGFGLSIVQQAAQAHDWEIRVTAGEAGGARFEVTGVEPADECR